MDNIKTFEAYIASKNETHEPGHEEGEPVVLPLTELHQKLKEAWKSEALEVHGNDTESTLNESMCEMMKENAALAAMAAKELMDENVALAMAAGTALQKKKDEGVKEDHEPSHEPGDETSMNENPVLIGMAAQKLMDEMKKSYDEAFDMAKEDLSKGYSM